MLFLKEKGHPLVQIMQPTASHKKAKKAKTAETRKANLCARKPMMNDRPPASAPMKRT
jgi:hypothetical protein